MSPVLGYHEPFGLMPRTRGWIEFASGSPVASAGTVNATGSFVMGADRVGSDTLLSRIVHMVGEAQRTRAPIQRLADVIAARFVEVVTAIAAVTAAVRSSIWPSGGGRAH